MEDNTSVSTTESSEGSTGAEVDSHSQGDVQASGSEGTQTSAGQSDQTSQEESFFDPNQVPEELKPAYKKMQADYTRKTQEIAARQKQFTELEQKAKTWSQYEQYVPILEEMLKSPAKGTQQQVNPQMTALEQEMAKQGYSKEAIDMIKLGAQFVLNQVNQTQEQKEAAVKLDTNIRAAEAVDPRLSDKSLVYQTEDGQSLTYGDIVSQIVLSRSDWTKDPVGETKRAIKIVDALIGQAKTQGKEELSASAKAKGRKFAPVNSSPQNAAKADQNFGSMREAAAAAKDELGLS